MARSIFSSARAVGAGVVVLALLVGCRQDYMNNRDTVEFTAGSAMRGNAVVHTVDPWPAHAAHTHQPTDARKAQNALETYREKPKRQPSSGNKLQTTSK
ncbi:MAG: hypothetical protein AAFQ42_11305 [Pseudomonadota bacterium]